MTALRTSLRTCASMRARTCALDLRPGGRRCGAPARRCDSASGARACSACELRSTFAARCSASAFGALERRRRLWPACQRKVWASGAAASPARMARVKRMRRVSRLHGFVGREAGRRFVPPSVPRAPEVRDVSLRSVALGRVGSERPFAPGSRVNLDPLNPRMFKSQKVMAGRDA